MVVGAKRPELLKWEWRPVCVSAEMTSNMIVSKLVFVPFTQMFTDFYVVNMPTSTPIPCTHLG